MDLPLRLLKRKKFKWLLMYYSVSNGGTKEKEK